MRALVTLLALTALIGCKKDDPVPEPSPEPGELLVGVGRARMPVPVGIGTVGYGGFGFSEEPSPFAEIYPATTRVHDHPDFRAVAITRGEGFEAIFLRADTVGVFQQFRRGVVLELEDRLGRNLDHALIIGATHTHSGPGRVIDAGGPFELIADKFFPEHYERMVQAMADAVEAALLDAKPGRMGWVMGRDDLAANDRRCEDGAPDHVNGTLPILAVEQEGQLKALVMAYAIHGTVLNIDDLTLSQDVSGGIEQAVEDRFDTPVQVQMHNSWGADMSPGSPTVPTGPGAAVPAGYDQMEAVGQSVADAVEAAIGGVVWEEEPEILLETHRIPIDREHIGYPDDVFENYPYGGVYCGSGYESDCDVATTNLELDDACIPFNETFPAPNQTEVTVGRVGATHLVTFPGEPGTALAEGILEELGNFSGVEQVMFVGYGQDYLGYSIEEEDWWQGGYEASGAIWGPRQGEYLAGEVVAAFASTFGFAQELQGPEPVAPFGNADFTPYVGPTPTDFGAVLAQPASALAGADAVAVFTVAGADPWWGAPLAYLEHADGTPVNRPNGLPVTSDGQAFWIDLAVDPAYGDGIDVPSRQFQWSFSLPLQHVVVGAGPAVTAGGSYRLRVVLPDGEGGSTEVTSDPFTWSG